MEITKFARDIEHIHTSGVESVDGHRTQSVTVTFRTTDEANVFLEFVHAYEKLHNTQNIWADQLHSISEMTPDQDNLEQWDIKAKNS